MWYNLLGTIILTMFFYVYVLESAVDGNRYIGFTNDLAKRLEEHKKGRVRSTKLRRPLSLIYFEACVNQKDATRREKYFKQTGGRRFLSKRLREHYLSKI